MKVHRSAVDSEVGVPDFATSYPVLVGAASSLQEQVGFRSLSIDSHLKNERI